MKLKTVCDMGSIKIFNRTMSVFFMNKIGDVPNTVTIHNKPFKNKDWEFLGHFTVKTKAWLSYYDCEDDKIYEFGKGRWFVSLEKDTHFHIEKIDEELHS